MFKRSGYVRSQKQNFYNLQGKIITKEAVESIVGVPIRNVQLFINAFTHKSYSIKPKEISSSCSDSHGESSLEDSLEDFDGEFYISTPDGTFAFEPTENYDRLEFMGDSIFNGVVTEYLFDTFPDIDQGKLTIYRSKIIRNDNLATFVTKLGLEKYLLISEKEAQAIERSPLPSKILGDIFEAFIGALYFDYVKSFKNPGQAFEVCRTFIRSIISRFVDIDKVKADINYNDQMLQFYQRNRYGQPVYQIIREPIYEEINGKKVRCIANEFEVCVSLFENAPHGVNWKLIRLTPPNGVKKTFKVGDTLQLYQKDGKYTYYPEPGATIVPNFKQTIVGIGISQQKQPATQEASKNALQKYFKIN